MDRHTLSLSLLHRQDLWVNFCSTQYKCDNMDLVPKQREAQQDSIHRKFVMWGNLSCGAMSRILHITKMDQFVIDSHDTIAPHDNFVMWWKIAWHVLEFCSTHNLCGVCDEYGVCRQTYENIRPWHLSVVVIWIHVSFRSVNPKRVTLHWQEDSDGRGSPKIKAEPGLPFIAHLWNLYTMSLVGTECNLYIRR